MVHSPIALQGVDKMKSLLSEELLTFHSFSLKNWVIKVLNIIYVSKFLFYVFSKGSQDQFHGRINSIFSLFLFFVTIFNNFRVFILNYFNLWNGFNFILSCLTFEDLFIRSFDLIFHWFGLFIICFNLFFKYLNFFIK